MFKLNSRTPSPDRRRIVYYPGWNHAGYYALALTFFVLPIHAQHTPRISPTGGRCNEEGPCATSTMPDAQPFMKPEIVNDEKCLPWNLSAAQTSTLSVTALKVPSRARGQYEKGCNASRKKKFEESEQHLRRAIDKFKDYSAAWVMLGV